MDAIVLLKDDHKTVEKLFKQFEKAGDGAHVTKQKIIEELTIHAFIEETIFYPAARAAVPDTASHVLESVEEHHVVVWMLSELSKMDPKDERYDAKVTVLIGERPPPRRGRRAGMVPPGPQGHGPYRADRPGRADGGGEAAGAPRPATAVVRDRLTLT
jgi:hypothetical protein